MGPVAADATMGRRVGKAEGEGEARGKDAEVEFSGPFLRGADMTFTEPAGDNYLPWYQQRQLVVGIGLFASQISKFVSNYSVFHTFYC